jgi:hypothetical protein
MMYTVVSKLFDPDPQYECGSGSRRAKKTHEKEKLKKFKFNCWIFSRSLVLLHGSLESKFI